MEAIAIRLEAITPSNKDATRWRPSKLQVVFGSAWQVKVSEICLFVCFKIDEPRDQTEWILQQATRRQNPACSCRLNCCGEIATETRRIPFDPPECPKCVVSIRGQRGAHVAVWPQRRHRPCAPSHPHVPPVAQMSQLSGS